MRKSRFQAKLKAMRLSINGLKPISYLNILSPDARKTILGRLKERLEEGSLGFELPKVMPVKKWKDMDGREV